MPKGLVRSLHGGGEGQGDALCLSKETDVEGAEVISVEGLGIPQNPHLIQEAFVLSGAIQCRYSAPGMIITARALLLDDPNPSVEEIKRALGLVLGR
jgi:aldehyde oxidoreductase